MQRIRADGAGASTCPGSARLTYLRFLDFRHRYYEALSPARREGRRASAVSRASLRLHLRSANMKNLQLPANHNTWPKESE
jgi:hypothetical protein